MSTHSISIEPIRHRDFSALTSDGNTAPTRHWLQTGMALVSLLLLAVLLTVSGAILAGRAFSAPATVNLPQSLLPGSVIPEDAECSDPGGMPQACTIYHKDMVVHIMPDQTGGQIALTVISTQAYTIGDLIHAWGMPTGFAQSGRAVDVYWGMRYAYLVTCSFQPESRVDFIALYPYEHVVGKWHGFTAAKGACAGG